MTSTFFLDEAAKHELIEAIAWYEGKQERVGERFASAVEAAIASLPTRQLRPLKGYQHRGAFFVEVGDRFPYRLIVVERGDTYRIVAVAHHRREAGYWLKRL